MVRVAGIIYLTEVKVVFTPNNVECVCIYIYIYMNECPGVRFIIIIIIILSYPLLLVPSTTVGDLLGTTVGATHWEN